MKKTVLGLVIVGLLAGCSSTGTKPVPVVDNSQQDAAARASAKAAVDKAAADKAAAEARALEQGKVSSQTNPLTDSSNVLSQRTVYFDYDQYSVKDEYRPMIEAHAA